MKSELRGGAGSGPVLELVGVSAGYGSPDSPPVLSGIDLAVPEHGFISLVGPSGAGKTTLLRCIAGLLRPRTGEVRFEGRAISDPPDGLSVVFQDYSRSLMPWLKVASNVALPLRAAGVPKAERTERALEALEAVGLPDAGGKYPWELSGGMQQRVAIARAIASRPRVLVMDEPFASVDAQTRLDLEDLTLRLRRRLSMTVLLVTHDIDEAVYMADQVVALSGRPTTIAERLEVDLGAERDQVETKTDPRFTQTRGHVLRLIQRKVPAQ